MNAPEKVCIVGAGSSGITACQVLAARGIPFDCFEKGSKIGGNWRYENDNGLSSAYRSLHINSGRRIMSYRAYPMPDNLPDYPDHFQIAKYFDDYVEHFGLAERITFNTEVKGVEPVDGEWEVTVEGPDGRPRDAPLPGGPGRQRPPLGPALARTAVPRLPTEFAGEQIHVHHYREPDVLVGKRVLILGIGNSAVDIAVESSRIAEATFLAMRRGAYVLPKFLGGKPIDEVSPAWTTFLPLPMRRVVMERMLNMAVGDVTDYGLPKPDHKLLEAHPTVSSELLPRLGHGDIDGQAEHRPLQRRPDRPLRRRQRGGDRPRRLLHRLQDHLPVPVAGGVRGEGQPDAALQAGRLGRAPRPLLHRLHPAAGADHADRRGPVRMGRRPARRPGAACPRRPRCGPR